MSNNCFEDIFELRLFLWRLISPASVMVMAGFSAMTVAMMVGRFSFLCLLHFFCSPSPRPSLASSLLLLRRMMGARGTVGPSSFVRVTVAMGMAWGRPTPKHICSSFVPIDLKKGTIRF